MSDIIFVCTGNTCRSPMAAAMAAAMFEREGITLAVSSAGVGAAGGQTASANAVLAMLDEGLDLCVHQSKTAAPETLENAALVLTMTSIHLDHVKAASPNAKVFTLGEYAGTGAEISDPFGGNLEEYRKCAAQIKELLTLCMEKFKAGL